LLLPFLCCGGRKKKQINCDTKSCFDLDIYQEEWSELEIATEHAGIRQVPVEGYTTLKPLP